MNFDAIVVSDGDDAPSPNKHIQFEPEDVAGR